MNRERQSLTCKLLIGAEVERPRSAAVCREITKMYEEVIPGDLAALAERYYTEAAPKGEMVVVIGPPPAGGRDALSNAELDRQLQAALARGSLRDAVAAVSEATGAPRRRVYARALTLSHEAK